MQPPHSNVISSSYLRWLLTSLLTDRGRGSRSIESGTGHHRGAELGDLQRELEHRESDLTLKTRVSTARHNLIETGCLESHLEANIEQSS